MAETTQKLRRSTRSSVVSKSKPSLITGDLSSKASKNAVYIKKELIERTVEDEDMLVVNQKTEPLTSTQIIKNAKNSILQENFLPPETAVPVSSKGTKRKASHSTNSNPDTHDLDINSNIKKSKATLPSEANLTSNQLKVKIEPVSLMDGYTCGLCGKARDLIKTQCCQKWICNDLKSFSDFARDSCFRNHHRFTLCSYHYSEGHQDKWQDCEFCQNIDVNEEAFELK
jgi:hypothetical protein